VVELATSYVSVISASVIRLPVGSLPERIWLRMISATWR